MTSLENRFKNERREKNVFAVENEIKFITVYKPLLYFVTLLTSNHISNELVKLDRSA